MVNDSFFKRLCLCGMLFSLAAPMPVFADTMAASSSNAERVPDKARQMADFFVAHYPDKLVYWQAEIATNNILYKHLVMLADEQLRALRK